MRKHLVSGPTKSPVMKQQKVWAFLNSDDVWQVKSDQRRGFLSTVGAETQNNKEEKVVRQDKPDTGLWFGLGTD